MSAQWDHPHSHELRKALGRPPSAAAGRLHACPSEVIGFLQLPHGAERIPILAAESACARTRGQEWLLCAWLWAALVSWGRSVLGARVQNHGARRAVLPLKALGRVLRPLPAAGGRTQSLACGHITLVSASVFTWPLPASVSKSPSPMRTPGTALGPAPAPPPLNQSHLQARLLNKSSHRLWVDMNSGGHRLPPFGPTLNPMVLFPHTHTASLDRHCHPAASTAGRHILPGVFWTLVWKQRQPTAVSSSPPACSPQRLPVRPARAQSSRPASRSRGITESGLHVCRGPCASRNFQDIWRGGSWRRRELLTHPSLAMAEPHLGPACWLGARGSRPWPLADLPQPRRQGGSVSHAG